MDVARRVRLGTTDVAVTQLGLGTASMGGWPEEQSEEDAVAAIRAAWDSGVRYFDQNSADFSVHVPDAVWADLKAEGLLPDEAPVPTMG
jgi:hypothetical protein